MKIELTPSRRMEARRTYTEQRVIRIPKKYRDTLRLEIGQFINLEAHAGPPITLEVRPALFLDTLVNERVAYLSPTNYSKTKLANNEYIDIEEITLGCDPEFFLLKPDGTIANPYKYFNKWDPMGHDGLLAEIRPMPHSNPTSVVENMRKLLCICREKLDASGNRDVTMHAKSSLNGLTAGFHLHYGLPKILLKPANINRKVLAKVVQALDYYVALPCVLQEGVEDSLRRSSLLIPYGKIGDFRMDETTLEYRVPGASMLKHPVLAAGLLALGAAVVEDAISRIKSLTDNFINLHKLDLNRSLVSGLPTAEHLHRMICVPNIDSALIQLEILKADINNMYGYKKRKQLIDALFNHLQLRFSSNIEDNWDLTPKQEELCGRLNNGFS